MHGQETMKRLNAEADTLDPRQHWEGYIIAGLNIDAPLQDRLDDYLDLFQTYEEAMNFLRDCGGCGTILPVRLSIR